MTTVVQVVEVNRVRLLELGAMIEALAGAIAAGEGTSSFALEALEPVRELLGGLRSLSTQALPEGMMGRTTELDVELSVPAHELEQIADELVGLADLASTYGADRAADGIGQLRVRLLERAATR